MRPQSTVVAFMAFHCQLTAHVTLLSLLGIMTSVPKVNTVTSVQASVTMERRKYIINIFHVLSDPTTEMRKHEVIQAVLLPPGRGHWWANETLSHHEHHWRRRRIHTKRQTILINWKIVIYTLRELWNQHVITHTVVEVRQQSLVIDFIYETVLLIPNRYCK